MKSFTYRAEESVTLGVILLVLRDAVGLYW